MYSGSPLVKSGEVESYAYCLGHFKPSRLAAFKGDGLNEAHQEYSTVAISGLGRLTV
jgi:hypothetical protein